MPLSLDANGASLSNIAQSPRLRGPGPTVSDVQTTSAPPFAQAGAPPAFSVEWAAGFADGEACIHVARQTYQGNRRDTYVLRVSIVQNDLQLLQFFQKGLGIHAGIYAVKRNIGQNRQCYSLNYNGIHALQLILLLGPFLVRKRLEAVTA